MQTQAQSIKSRRCISVGICNGFRNDNGHRYDFCAGGRHAGRKWDRSIQRCRHSYKDSLGNGTSTRYAGRVWTDKTVYTGNAVFTNDENDNTIEVEKSEDADFLISYSALASSQQITQLPKVPVDVVFVLDFSSSMCWGVGKETVSESDGSDSRIAYMIDALNETIDTLREDNPNNRIGIVYFNRTGHTLLELTELSEANLDGIEEDENGTTQYLTMSWLEGSTGNDDGKAVVTCHIGNDVTATTDSKTNIQYGLYEGMSMLADEKNTIYDYEGMEYTRIPNVVLMSDGAPTTISMPANDNSWWAGLDYNDGESGSSGDNNNAWSGKGFMPMITAEYLKNKIDANYADRAKNANAQNPEQASSSMYTIGFSINSQTESMVELANMVLNPSENWDTANLQDEQCQNIVNSWSEYVQGKDTIVDYPGEKSSDSGRNFTVTHPTGSDAIYDVTSGIPSYVDQYYPAESSDALGDAFRQITSTITESAKAPTEVSGNDPVHDGYITYTDTIGDYMEIKDISTIIWNSQEFTNPTVSTVGNVTTYTFSGEINSPVYGTHNASEIQIQVESSGTGTAKTETLTVRIPASAIPVRVNGVEVNADGTVGSNESNNEYPLRVLYSVGLIDGVADQNGILNEGVVSDEYADTHTDEDGNLLFYSNKYSGNMDNGWEGSQTDDVTVGDAYVEFTPASDNPFYYVQDNTNLYLDADCTQPATGKLDENTTYYFQISYYDVVGTSVQTAVLERPGSEIDSNYVSATRENGQLQLQEGAPRLGNLSDFIQMKEDTSLTNTADSSYYPTYQGNGVFRVYLGNNGVLPVKTKTAMENTKDVVQPGTDTSLDGKLVGVGDQLEYVIHWVNDATDSAGKYVAADVTVTDQVPVGTSFVSAENEGTEENGTVTWNLGTQEAGASGTVRFTVEVTEDAINYDSIQNTASIQPGDNDPKTTNTVTNYVPKKEVTGTDSDGNASVGDTLTYTIAWRNTEAASADVTIVDVLDEGLDYIENSANPSATYDEGTHTLTWVVENAAAGAQGSVTFQAQVNENAADTTVENQATVQIDNQAGVSTNPVETPVNPENPGGITGDVDVTLSGTKTMTGRTLQSSDQFQFTIEAVNGAPLPEQTTVTNNGASIVFGPINYTQAGQYEYTIRETGGSAAGVTNDSGSVHVVVNVSQNSESGALTSEVSYEKQGGNGGEGFAFVNVYQPSPTSAVGGFEAVKTVEASEGNSYTMTGGEFSFSIIPSSDNPDSDPVQAATVTNSTDGNVVLSSPVQYTEAGTYRYTVREENSTVGGITKDNSVYIITVVVTEDTSNAALSADVTITKDGREVSGISFTNTYNPAQTGISFGGKKVLNGGTLEEGAFSFTLTATSGADTPMPQDGTATVTNDTAGTY